MNFHWKNYRILIPSLLIVGLLLFGLGRWIYYANKNDIHIAIVGPMTGTSSANGLSYVQGVKLFTEKINQSGGIDGKHIVLNIYDDQNKADLAKAKAEELVKKNRVLAVIGHNSSDCSIAAGEIYKTAEIPAITPASTNVKVTVGNEWYFRTIFNDNSQGRFLANYVKKILKYSEVKIVHEELRYGKYLTEVFEATAKEIGLKITYKKEFSTVSPTKEKDLENIVKELKAKNDNQLIFIPMHVPEGAVFVRLLKDHGLNNPVIAPDAFASAGFIEELKKQKREQLNPGFYSNEMLVTTPLIFDNANQKAQQFRDEYMLAYGKEPDWRAVYAYDSVMILVEAIRKTEINGSKSAIKEERKKIKEFLQGIDSPSEGIEGATGLNYFDENGDSPKPVSIGSYKNNEIISNLTQLQAVRDPSEILNPEKAIKEERMLLVDNKYLYKTNVVYTGIEINEIKDLDIGKQTYFMDFYLWFRYTGNIDPENIEFLNSEKPIALGKPIDQDPSEKMSYKVYHVKGKFKAETLPVKYVLEQNSLGISFRHKTLNRNNLIYVIDEIGIGKHIKKETLKNSQILSSSYGWTIANTWAFQDTLKKNSLGSPRYLSLQDTTVPYSRFNMGIRIKKNEITHRRILPGVITMYIFLFCLAGIMVVGIISSLKSYKSFTNYFWTAQIILTFLMINSAEVETIEYLVDRDNIDKIKLVLNIFDLIWWIVPAIVLTQAIERFLWRPLEIKTEHKIPTVVRRFLNFLIYLLTFFGIVAFVYDQKITSLLATSGVVAMIIGLAIQVNIANVFSGIAINMERPFRVGDWIKIGTMDEGRVVDITWRTTRIRLRNQVMVSVPNSMASEAAIINYSLPDGIVEMWFTIHIDPNENPQRVVKVLMDALLSSEGVVKDPAPYARFNEFSDWSADYLFGYCFKDYTKKNPVRKAVWQNVWTHLHRAGIRPSFAKQEVFLNKGKMLELEDVRSPISVVEGIYIFNTFSPEEKVILSEKLKPMEFFEGQVIVKAGDDTNFSMYVIREGVVSVQAPLENGDFIEVAKLGAGNIFGEMSLLTGAVRTANILAASHTFIYEITKEDIAPLLEKHPEIYNNVKQVSNQRKENLQTKKQEAMYVPPPKQESLMTRLRRKIYGTLGLLKEIEELHSEEAPKEEKKT